MFYEHDGSPWETEMDFDLIIELGSREREIALKMEKACSSQKAPVALWCFFRMCCQ